MLKGNRIYVFVLLMAVLLIGGTSYLWSLKSNVWKVTYASDDKNPFGTALVLEVLPQVFTKQKIQRVDRPIFNFLKDKKLQHSNYIFIGNEFSIQNADMKALLNYVSDGNNVFIASNAFSAEFEDTLGFYTAFSMERQVDLFHLENTKETYENQLVNPQYKANNSFAFKGIEDGYQLIPEDTTSFKVLAVDNANNPVFIKTKYGEGTIYLHSFPLAFTNYYLLFKQHHAYIERCLSSLEDQATYWDDYYKVPHQQEISKLAFIYQHPALEWAWYLAISLCCLYVLFRIKRQQRVIPQHASYVNSSLEFATTIGRLYYSKRDHNDLMKKQATYWLSYIRSQLNIPTSKLDDVFIQQVSDKSGVESNDIKEMIDYIGEIQIREMKDSDVKRFYTLIQKFYKKSKR